METVYLPNFLKDLPDIEIFRRLEVFTNLAVKFTSRMSSGIDRSMKTMKTLLEHPPLQGPTTINNVLDLLKDVVLAYQAVKLTGNVHLPRDPAATKEKITKFKLFPKATRHDVSKMLNSLSDAVTEHKAVMTKLRDARKKYISIKSRLKCTETQDTPTENKSPEITPTTQTSTTQAISETSLEAPLFATQSVTTQVTPVQSAITQVTSDSSLDTSTFTTQSKTTKKAGRKSFKKIVKIHEAALKAYVGFRIFADKERQLRKDKLNQIETIVRNLIEDRICGILEIGHSRLMKFGEQFDLPEDVMDRLDQFDVHHVTSQIYNQLSTRYIFPAVEDYSDETQLPPSWFESPNLKAQDKHEIRLGKSGSSMNLLEEDQNEYKHEELYVWANQDSSQIQPEHFLSFHTGQRMKQKFCSDDGSLAFGWKRVLPGCKTFGFYPTNSVSLVP